VTRILLVEDEPEMARLIAAKLGKSGFIADHMRTLSEAHGALEAHSYACVILDRRLPDGDGVTLLADIRKLQPGLRVLVVTACDAVNDRIDGLDAGADDYLTKPFDADELMARVRACLRRPGGERLPPVVIGALSFDLDAREARIHGESIVLHRRELALLETLVRNAGRVVLRTSLMDEIYGFDDDIQGNALNILVSRLRRRLFDHCAGVEIHSARGIGYLLKKST
jgi:two-component system, OmpR family, response regulator